MNGRNLAAFATAAAVAAVVVLIALRAQGAQPVAVTSPLGVMTLLLGIAAFWFWVEQRTERRLFGFVPPLLFIDATPIFLSNTGVLPFSSIASDRFIALG